MSKKASSFKIMSSLLATNCPYKKFSSGMPKDHIKWIFLHPGSGFDGMIHVADIKTKENETNKEKKHQVYFSACIQNLHHGQYT